MKEQTNERSGLAFAFYKAVYAVSTVLGRKRLSSIGRVLGSVPDKVFDAADKVFDATDRGFNAMERTYNSSRLRSVYDMATGHRRLEKMGIAEPYGSRGRIGAFGGVMGFNCAAWLSLFVVPTVIAGAPLALLAILPAIMAGLAFAPLQLHSLYKAGQTVAVEAGIEQPASQDSQKPEPPSNVL